MKQFTAPFETKFTDDNDDNYPMKELTFLGLSAIMDPPRDDTANAIRECKQAGIKVFMVTGDHESTATAIARQIGLIADDNDEVVDNRIIAAAKLVSDD